MAKRPAEEDLSYAEGVGSDLDTMLVFNLMRTHSHLAPLVDADLRSRSLTSAQLNTLLVLRSAGKEGLQMGQVGLRLVVTKANVTGLIDRLERQRLVERADHSDRRATIIRLTAAGRRLLDQIAPDHAKALGELTGCLCTSEKRRLIQSLTKLRRQLRLRRKEES